MTSQDPAKKVSVDSYTTESFSRGSIRGEGHFRLESSHHQISTETLHFT